MIIMKRERKRTKSHDRPKSFRHPIPSTLMILDICILAVQLIDGHSDSNLRPGELPGEIPGVGS